LIKKYYSFFIVLLISKSLSSSFSSGGEITNNQKAMDVKHYNIDLKVDPFKKTIAGSVIITFSIFRNIENIEIDLINKYTVSGTLINGMSLAFEHKNNKLFIYNPGIELFKDHFLEIKYVGRPPISSNPPWEGGFVWEKNTDENHWIGLACQSSGANIWYPCKEHPSDKANSAEIKITVPKPLKVVSNGILQSVESSSGQWQTWYWKTDYPISPYNINFTIGYFKIIEKIGYVLDKPLKMYFYALPKDYKKGKDLLNTAEEYLNFYARNFGQFPWIKEKFGIVQTPYWGMEHQTSIAYGNNFKKTDLGYDFLLFHELGHEWWGNYLSVTDWSDFWIHEGFNTYAEALYIEEKFSLETSINFINKKFKKSIKNKKPILPNKGVKIDFFEDNDVYYKGAHILHTLRYLIGNDILRESLKEFLYMPKEWSNNQTNTDEFISLIEENSGQNLKWFFNRYLRENDLPQLNVKEIIIKNKKFFDLWWEDEGFKMPIKVVYNAFDKTREKKIELNNSPKRIVIPINSTLIIDPESWILFKTNNISS